MRVRELCRQVVEPFQNSVEGCPRENAKVSIYVQNEAVPQGALDSRGDIYHAKMTRAARSNTAISKAETIRNWGGGVQMGLAIREVWEMSTEEGWLGSVL